MNTSNRTKQAIKEEYVKRRKKVREEKVGSGNTSTDSVTSGSGTDYQISIPLGWAPW
jgi:hypothetical protein